jgi:hypothetical protein
VPSTAYKNWQAHYKTFKDIHDFEGAFIQNIMGNFLSFIDIYNKTTIAAENGDYMTVVFQLARLVRRIIDFRTMEREVLIRSLNAISFYLNVLATVDKPDLTNP